MARIFYCPRHGRVTEPAYEERLVRLIGGVYYSAPFAYPECEHCDAWYYRRAKVKVKRAGES